MSIIRGVRPFVPPVPATHSPGSPDAVVIIIITPRVGWAARSHPYAGGPSPVVVFHSRARRVRSSTRSVAAFYSRRRRKNTPPSEKHTAVSTGIFVRRSAPENAENRVSASISDRFYRRRLPYSPERDYTRAPKKKLRTRRCVSIVSIDRRNFRERTKGGPPNGRVRFHRGRLLPFFNLGRRRPGKQPSSSGNKNATVPLQRPRGFSCYQCSPSV